MNVSKQLNCYKIRGEEVHYHWFSGSWRSNDFSEAHCREPLSKEDCECYTFEENNERGLAVSVDEKLKTGEYKFIDTKVFTFKNKNKMQDFIKQYS